MARVSGFDYAVIVVRDLDWAIDSYRSMASTSASEAVTLGAQRLTHNAQRDRETRAT